MLKLAACAAVLVAAALAPAVARSAEAADPTATLAGTTTYAQAACTTPPCLPAPILTLPFVVEGTFSSPTLGEGRYVGYLRRQGTTKCGPLAPETVTSCVGVTGVFALIADGGAVVLTDIDKKLSYGFDNFSHGGVLSLGYALRLDVAGPSRKLVDRAKALQLTYYSQLVSDFCDFTPDPVPCKPVDEGTISVPTS
jgi:hypothetical protein